MSSFLGELAQQVLKEYGDKLAEVQVIFPNRRAGVFFRKELGKLIEHPVWLPRIYSMEDFVVGRSDLTQIDKLEGVFLLYDIYQKYQPEAEHFDKFFFWGEMILKDFEEIDHYRVDAEKLFTTIRSQKELEEAFYFLDEEDRKIIEEFWNTFLPDIDDAQANFLKTWEILYPVYNDFREQLITEKKGYNGLIYRQVAERLEAGERLFDGDIIYAGFNALTGSEEAIISWCVKELGSQVHWDLDAYYVEPAVQEAGVFFREYRSKAPLSGTFPKELPRRFEQSKEMTVTGVPLEVGQTKAMISRLEELAGHQGFEPEKTVIVLPHEYMLHPVLHAIPDNIELLNITMGYPLNASNTFGLIDSLLKLQNNHRNHLVNGVSFYHRPLLELLDHPLIQPLDEKSIAETIKQVKKRNLIYVYPEDLPIKHPLILHMLSLHEDAMDFLLDILSRLDKVWEDNGFHDFELEFIRRYYQTYAQLKKMLTERGEKLGYEFLIRLHRRISGSLKVPFTGEPLNGLQVMGILETRNLDFDHVLVVNMNEDSWPAPAQRGSFVPFNIRKAFDMPVHDHQDAIYSYLFYRLLQRCKTVDFYYNTVSEFSMNGEPSRLLQQLELESLHVLDRRLLVNPITVAPPKTIEIVKSDRIFDRLNRFVEDAPLPKGISFHSRLTPSALETYLYCRLRFYFRYVEELYEELDLQEDMDAMLFGNILHDAMELLYKDHLEGRKTRIVSEMDFFALETAVNGAINKAFLNSYQYKDAKKFQLEGRNVIAYDVIRKMVLRILQIDKQHAPFEIMGLEADTKDGYAREYPVTSRGVGIKVRLKGKIDRIDRKDGVIRVVDYKTGKDEKRFTSIESLIDREDKSRNKAAFQVMFYAWLVKHSELYVEGAPIEPGLFNNKDLFQKDFDWKIYLQEPRKSARYAVQDFREYEETFEEILKSLLTEIWDEAVPFTQVEDAKKCQYCEFKGICGR
jgi:CRISPR/Cas system-associated exonuclease Cas4 (RecB family)